ncbi:MAG: GNAT family N-acetyltransferase [Pseudomonadota bacterium]
MTLELTQRPEATTGEQRSYDTDRFTLRPLRLSDKGLIELYASDIRVAGPTRSIPHPLPPGATETFIEGTMAVDRTEDVWAVDGTKSGLSEVLGVIGLEHMDRNQAKLGYWFAPAFWGKGFARETVGALVTANPLAADTIFAEVFQDNPASARVLTHCDFNYLGDAEAYCVARHTSMPTWTYSKKM